MSTQRTDTVNTVDKSRSILGTNLYHRSTGIEEFRSQRFFFLTLIGLKLVLAHS